MMFARRLHLLLSYQTRVTCSKFHRNNYSFKVNLTFPYQQLKRNNVYLRNTSSPINTVRSCSNLSVNKYDRVENDDNDSIHAVSHEVRPLTENGYFYSILSNSDKYKKTIIPSIEVAQDVPQNLVIEILKKDYTDASVHEILEDFQILSRHAKLNSTRPSDLVHEKLFSAVARYIPDLMNEQLWDLMKYMKLWFPMDLRTQSKSFENIIIAIDNSLLERGNSFTPDEMLMGCDLMYSLRRPRDSHFIKKVIQKLGLKPGKMSPENYIHFMFILNVIRQSAINMYEVEYALEPFIHLVSPDEVGIIAAAFFKTKTSIRNPKLLEKIAEKCINNMDEMGSLSICAVMKIMRFTMPMKQDLTLVRSMIRKYESLIDRATVPSLVHAAHLAATVLLDEKKIIDKILEKFNLHLSTARAKDLERILFVLTIYNYPKDFPTYELIISELRKPERESEYLRFHKCYICALMFLSHVGIYPLDIISKILDHNYSRGIHNDNPYKMGQPYLLLEFSLKIEVPEYTGPFLPTKIRDYLIRKYSAHILHNENPEFHLQFHQRTLFDVLKYTEKILGAHPISVCQLLPHHERADIVYCVDSDYNISPQQIMSNPAPGTIVYPPEVPAGHKWIVIVIASYNHVFRNTSVTCGTINSKLRQLKTIGYTPVVVVAPIWRKLDTQLSKENYLRNILPRNNNNKIGIKELLIKQ